MAVSRRLFLGSALGSAMVVMAQEAAKAVHLQPVDAKYVCFVNKHRFDKPQIPVTVDGQTYYGCCSMCTSKLKSDPASRYDVDPVSGKRVDKANAVIGVDADNKVYFFENEQDLESFQPPSRMARK